jgi:large subunit ribosomal protein L25
MRIGFEIQADFRDDQGKGASRRLRRQGKIPAIIYGGKLAPRQISLDHQKLLTLIDNEKLYSSIIRLQVGTETQEAIIKDVQMHPAKRAIVHIDMQRVLADEKIRIYVPIHFTGAAAAPGVKTQGGIVSHRISDVEVVCLPKDFPEFLEVDMSEMQLNDTKFLSDIPLPEGVVIPQLQQGRNVAVVSVHAPRAAEPEPTEVAAAAEGAVAAATPAATEPAAKEGGGKK